MEAEFLKGEKFSKSAHRFGHIPCKKFDFTSKWSLIIPS
jgi:hypothetical protein